MAGSKFKVQGSRLVLKLSHKAVTLQDANLATLEPGTLNLEP